MQKQYKENKREIIKKKKSEERKTLVRYTG